MAAQLKVALVHDWLTNQGGGEQVLWALHEAYPDAPIYTSVYRPEGIPQFDGLDVRTSFLQRVPLARKRHQLFPTLRTIAFESFDFRDYNVVISSSSAEAKGIITPPGTLHLSYIHTPTRYYWSDYARYLLDPGFGWLNPIVRLVMPRLVHAMREWDFAAAQRPDGLVANSKYVAARIQKYYRRDSTVIYPPVSLERFSSAKKHEDFYLVVSRLIPYKRIDLAVQACTKLGRKLVVISDGSERAALERMAGPTVTFLGRQSEAVINDYYSRAKAFLFCSDEDFGIVPLEAMASGTPVIAYGKGGALETVVEGETGLFFPEQTADSLVAAIEQFEKRSWSSAICQKRAKQFGRQRFIREIHELVRAELAKLPAQ